MRRRRHRALGCRHEDCIGRVVKRGWCAEHVPRCKEPGCNELEHSRGWCNRHYLRWYVHGDRTVAVKRGRPFGPPKYEPCAITGCENKAVARGVCHMHYKRLWVIRGWPAMRQQRPRAPRPPRVFVPKQPVACSVAGCGENTLARGLCSTHYRAWLRKQTA